MTTQEVCQEVSLRISSHLLKHFGGRGLEHYGQERTGAGGQRQRAQSSCICIQKEPFYLCEALMCVSGGQMPA